MKIRLFVESDLETLHAINAASTPGVSEESLEDLKQIISISTCLVAENESGIPLGFITLIAPGQLAYKSANLRWFETWLEGKSLTLNYVDRIALAREARGKRLGEALYDAAMQWPDSFEALGCEVNTMPDNPGSHRFHQRLNFKEVGRQAFSPEKAVAYYVRQL